MKTGVCKERAKFACEAIGNLARQVRRYCLSYPTNIQAMRGRKRVAELKKFIANANSLLMQLERMLKLARDIEAMDMLNHEQIEAEAELVRETVGKLACELAEVN